MTHDEIFENSRLVCTPHAKGDENLLALLRQVYMAGAFTVKRHYEQKLNIHSVSGSLLKQKLFTAKEIRKKLLQMNPQIKENSKYTNPFLYDDVKKWYEELWQ